MTKLFVANWKSNKNKQEVIAWIESFQPYVGLEQKVVIAPPYPFLDLVNQNFQDKKDISMAAQDLSPYPAGSYTGEVCTRNLTDLGVKYVILGHSERRRYFGESNLDVAKKATQAVESGIAPILCVDQEYIEDQASLLDESILENCLVAYEPSAAISTNGGDNASLEDVIKTSKKIKAAYGDVPVLYGGSVTPENVSEYLSVTDGVLVGGASLDAETFMRLIHNE